MSQQKILLLEDDNLLALTLQELLQESGYDVDLATDGNEAVDFTYENSYELYIFDINVPEISGLALLDALREADDMTPTIFISAMIDLKTMARGFELGAEDYIKKPFFPEELLLRVNDKMIKVTKEIVYKKLLYNPNTKVLLKDSNPIHLSMMLGDMFHLLIVSKGKIIDKDEFMDCMENPTSTALRVAITKLKKLLDIEITNIRGVGYSLE